MKKVVVPHPDTHLGVPRDPATPVRVPEAKRTPHAIKKPPNPIAPTSTVKQDKPNAKSTNS